MEQMKYEKPKMKFVTLQNQYAVANCWSDAANTPEKDWYYDYNKGELGYLKFNIVKECSGNDNSIYNISYLPDSVGKTTEAEAAEAYLKANLKTEVKQNFTSMITDDPTQVS